MLQPKKQEGFTLIELLIVIAIIGIIASIGVPSLLRSRMSAQQSAAIAALKTATSAQIDYFNNSDPRGFAESLVFLGKGTNAGNVGFIDADMSSGVKLGYTFELVPGAFNSGSYFAWSATAWPLSYGRTGVNSYYVDETGVIRALDVGGGKGDVNMPHFDTLL